MSKIQIKKLPLSRVEITGELTATDFKSYRPKAIAHFSEKLKIDGFRPGHVPEKVILDTVGEGALLEEMAELALAEHYPQIIIDNKIDALGRPEIKITKMAIGDDLHYIATTDVYPRVELPDYEQLIKEIEPLKPETVTDEEVDKIVTELEAGGHTDAKSHREKIRHNLVHEKKWRADEGTRREIIKKITSKLELELPLSLIEGELDKMLSELKGSLEYNGFPFTDYLKQINKTESDLRAAWQEQAIERVKFGLFSNALAEKEKLTPSSEKLNAAVDELRKNYPEVPEERLRAYAASALSNELVWQKLDALIKK